MQTFLPYADFRQCAATLDSRRLGKQRVEARQILNTIANPAQRGWQHHPAVRMWRGYEGALRLYMNAMIEEWVRRGYKNTMALASVPAGVALPPWLGNAAFHASHRANLLRKDPDYYARYGWSESPDLPYIWPVGDAGDAGNTGDAGNERSGTANTHDAPPPVPPTTTDAADHQTMTSTG